MGENFGTLDDKRPCRKSILKMICYTPPPAEQPLIFVAGSHGGGGHIPGGRAELFDKICASSASRLNNSKKPLLATDPWVVGDGQERPQLHVKRGKQVS